MIINTSIPWIIQLTIIPLMSPLVIGTIRKIKAQYARRQGASVFQPYRDLIKLFHKDEVISSDASWVFTLAPYIIFSITLILASSIPQITLLTPNFLMSDIVFFIYLIALGIFFLALAGMDVGSAFGGFGSSREVTLAALTEAGLLFSLLVLVLISGTTNFFGISAVLLGQGSSVMISLLFAGSGFFIALLAESARFPFDNPATHLELTMVHEAMILEYSGKRLALIEWAAANKLLIFMTILTSVFYPFGIATAFTLSAITYAIGLYLVKLFILCFVIATLESTIAKFRFFRLPDLLAVSFILSIIGLIMLPH